MCICTLTSHSTHTACPCAVDLCTRPFALENCVWLPVSVEALAFDSQTVDTDHHGALLTLLVPKCCPSSCQHSCSSETTLCQLNSTQHKTMLYLPDLYSLMFHSVGDFKVLEICTNVHHPFLHNTPLTTFQSFSSWADIKRCVKHKS